MRLYEVPSSSLVVGTGVVWLRRRRDRTPGLTLALSPNPDGAYDYGFGPFLSWGGGEPVTIQAQGASGGPGPFSHAHRMPVQPVLTSPLLPQTGDVPISVSQPLDFSWTVPAGAEDGSKFTATFSNLDGSSNMQCDYPLRKYGRGRIPADLLRRVATTPSSWLGFDARQEQSEFRSDRTELIYTSTAMIARTPDGPDASWLIQVAP